MSYQALLAAICDQQGLLTNQRESFPFEISSSLNLLPSCKNNILHSDDFEFVFLLLQFKRSSPKQLSEERIISAYAFGSQLIVDGCQSRTQGKNLEGGVMEKHCLLACCLDDAQNIFFFVLRSDYLAAGVLVSGFL